MNGHLPKGKNDDPSLDIRASQSAGKIPHRMVQEILTGHTLDGVPYGTPKIWSDLIGDNELTNNVGLYPVWAF